MNDQANTTLSERPRRHGKTSARAALPKPRPPSPRELRAEVIARGDPIAYRVQEALALLGIGRTKLYALIGDGRLAAASATVSSS